MQGCDDNGITFYSESTWDVELTLDDDNSNNNQIIFSGQITETSTTSWSLDSQTVTCRAVYRADVIGF